MGALRGPVICHTAVCIKDTGSYANSSYAPLANIRVLTRGAWGGRRHLKVGGISPKQYKKKDGAVHCTFRSSSDGNGSTAENFNENDEDYVNSVIIEAVEVRSSSDGFIIKMRDGNHVHCVHNHPRAGHSPDYAPHPAIVLKMEDDSGLLLPIVVLEMPSILLMAAIRNLQIARPTVYEAIKEMIDKMGYKVHLVRVTKRVQEAYFAKLYLIKGGDETEKISLDLRPSDAINIAVRCKAPIQVNKELAFTDGMRLVEPPQYSPVPSHSDGLLFSELDRPSNKPCLETVEFNLVRNMLIAVVEERYKDAAQWRDKLSQLRSQGKHWT